MFFDTDLAWQYLPSLLYGALVTLSVVVPVMAISLIVALPLAYARMSKNWFVAGFASLYVTVFRGAPALILLYLIYNGFAQMDAIRNGPLWFVFSSAYFCAVLGFTLNHSAYVVEILVGGLRAVPTGLLEASEALAFKPWQVLWRIRLPLAIRYGLKAYQNEVLLFLKGTAAVSAITLMDLMAAANEVFYFTYDPFTPLLTAAAIYWLMCNILRVSFDVLDARLNRHARVGDTAGRGAGRRVGAPALAALARPDR